MTAEKLIVEFSECYPGYSVGNSIICAKTGIFCTSQVNGIACSHPEVEGFYMNIFVNSQEDEVNFRKELEEFDDCKRGCAIGFDAWNSDDIEESGYLNKYVQAIDDFLVKNVSKKSVSGSIFEFDYSRITEVMEGWWPVLIRLKNTEYQGGSEPYKEKWYDTKLKGYLCFGSCD